MDKESQAQIRLQLSQDQTELEKLQAKYAAYFTKRSMDRIGIKADRQSDLEVRLKLAKRENAIDRAEQVGKLRDESKASLKKAISDMRKNEADERRGKMKVFDSETNGVMGKMKTRMSRLMVSIGRNKMDLDSGQLHVPEELVAVGKPEPITEF